ncbi:MAG: GIY-YIG nuclease family protein [Planctomycetota bacterium]
MDSTKKYFAYILRCSDGSFYVGSTDDVQERLLKHNSGRASTWTAARLPVKLLYQEVYETQEMAIQRERQIKKWSRAKKKALIAQETVTLKRLSSSKQKRHH